jgi:hypothetical protein
LGLILLPLYLAMLLGFASGGARLGWRAVVRARGRLTAACVLAAAAMGLAALAIALPFAFVAGHRVSAGGFAVMAALGVGAVAMLAGLSLNERFVRAGRPVDGLLASAFFLAGASFPLSWFWLGERMEALFQVMWVY